MVHRALKLAREFHRMKQVELAEKLGISPSYLSEIESGKKSVSVDLLNCYQEIFNVPASTFLRFSETAGHDGSAMRSRRGERLLQFFEWVTSEENDDEAEVATAGTPEEAV